MSKKKIANTVSDPTLPKTPITLDGTEYFLCFDLGALAEAEQAFLREGHNVNLLAALPVLNLTNARVIFAASIRKFQPEISYEEAVAMVTLKNVFVIANTIYDAWNQSQPEPETLPTQAVAE